jgi:hypothetical protein
LPSCEIRSKNDMCGRKTWSMFITAMTRPIIRLLLTVATGRFGAIGTRTVSRRDQGPL